MVISHESPRKMVFIGDSITDSGRRDVAVPYGNGYVSMIRNLMLARFPESNVTVVNQGIGGNTVRDLAARWDQDVIAERPNTLTIMVGINDVWRQFSGSPATAVYPPEYRETLRSLIQRTPVKPVQPRFILMSPYMIEFDRSLPIRARIDEYVQIVREVAAEFNFLFVDVQAAFDEALRVTPPLVWTQDSFHVNGPGAMLIARAWLKAIGFTL